MKEAKFFDLHHRALRAETELSDVRRRLENVQQTLKATREQRDEYLTELQTLRGRL